jgi:hypothetical protein
VGAAGDCGFVAATATADPASTTQEKVSRAKVRPLKRTGKMTHALKMPSASKRGSSNQKLSSSMEE